MADMADTGGRWVASTAGGLTVRGYEPSDRSGVRSLYEAAWNHPATEPWFDWKYVDNPFVAEPVMVVAERDGEIVGIRPVFDLPMRAGDRTVAGTLFSNTMVHPDARGEGVFSAMSEVALERTTDRSRDLVFCFANENSRPIYRNWGWREVGVIPKWYRIHDPVGLIATRDDPVRGAIAAPARAVARGYVRLREVGNVQTDLEVRREPDPSPALLAGLYRQAVPDTLHVERSEEFYRWRLASPFVEASAFVASRHGRPVAAAVVRTRELGRGRAVQLFDFVPLPGGRETGTEAASEISAVVAAIVAAYGDADAITAPGTVWRTGRLVDHGFLSNENPVVPAALSSDLTLFAVGRAASVEPYGELSAWSLSGTLIETV